MKYDHTGFTAQQAYQTGVNTKVARFLPMVRKLAWYYESSGGNSIDVDDLMQVGLIALTECAQRHDRPNDDGFAAYAKMRVRGAMIDLLRSQSERRRGALNMKRKEEATRLALRNTLGREPSSVETARAMGLSFDEYDQLRQSLATSVQPMEECYSDHNSAFEDGEPNAEMQLLQVEDRDGLIEAITQLPERLQLIVQLHFYEELNLTEIAAVMGVSVPRVHQLKSSALQKLRLGLVAKDD